MSEIYKHSKNRILFNANNIVMRKKENVNNYIINANIVTFNQLMKVLIAALYWTYQLKQGSVHDEEYLKENDENTAFKSGI